MEVATKGLELRKGNGMEQRPSVQNSQAQTWKRRAISQNLGAGGHHKYNRYRQIFRYSKTIKNHKNHKLVCLMVYCYREWLINDDKCRHVHRTHGHELVWVIIGNFWPLSLSLRMSHRRFSHNFSFYGVQTLLTSPYRSYRRWAEGAVKALCRHSEVWCFAQFDAGQGRGESTPRRVLFAVAFWAIDSIDRRYVFKIDLELGTAPVQSEHMWAWCRSSSLRQLAEETAAPLFNDFFTGQTWRHMVLQFLLS
jgi:hypothetical protein